MLVPLALVLVAAAAARRHAPGLRDDDAVARVARVAECQFGGETKELGEKWSADLGPPFGIMFCIKCECVTVIKKRRVLAKVQCRNIKNECPEPACDNPVLLYGNCCKTCPGSTSISPDFPGDTPIIVVPDEDSKHYGALLTGRTDLCIRRDDMTAVPLAHGVATARFMFRRRHLYWSLVLGSTFTIQPRAISFLDRDGRLLYERALKKAPGIHTTYEEKTGKLCGVWLRVPREYKRILRLESMYVALIWGDQANSTMENVLSGRITKYPDLAWEMFTTLLEPEIPPTNIGNSACDPQMKKDGWWGGTALITGATGAAPSLHVTIMFNGIHAADMRDMSVKVMLTMPEKNQTIIDEVERVSKASYEMNSIKVSAPVSPAELRSLARGRLLLSVEAVGVPERKVAGYVRQKATCEVYHAPLMTERQPDSMMPEGLAMLYIDKDGSLVYDIQAVNLGTSSPKITLVEEQSKRHSQVEILDSLSGVLARPSARVFPPLYDELLAVHVSGEAGPPILRGKLTSRLLFDATSPGPVLLRRTDNPVPGLATLSPAAALAWVSVDRYCSLHYEVVTAGNAGTWSAWLVAGHGHEQRALAGADGCVPEPLPFENVALNLGGASLELRAGDNRTVLLRTRLPQISVPPSCLPAKDWIRENYFTKNIGCEDQNGQSHEQGSQWLDNQSCQICACVHGESRCDPVRCPPVKCDVPTIQPAGHCCPICTNSTTAVWNESWDCFFAGQHHPPGSSWHPYLVPEGYDTCVICTCDYATRQVKCLRVRCPPLRCPEKYAYRQNKKDCCRVCPATIKQEEETPKDQGTPRTAEEILAEGGCNFPDGPLPNGKEVHPSIHSHGEQRCVTCRCKDGELTCTRKRCSRSACARRRRGDSCCACSRHRRQRARPPS